MSQLYTPITGYYGAVNMKMRIQDKRGNISWMCVMMVEDFPPAMIINFNNAETQIDYIESGLSIFAPLHDSSATFTLQTDTHIYFYVCILSMDLYIHLSSFCTYVELFK